MSEPTEMEKRVARALAESVSQGVQEVTDDLIPLFMMQARAAIRAMRVMSVEQLCELQNVSSPVERGDMGPQELWEFFIDIASPPRSANNA